MVEEEIQTNVCRPLTQPGERQSSRLTKNIDYMMHPMVTKPLLVLYRSHSLVNFTVTPRCATRKPRMRILTAMEPMVLNGSKL